MKTFIDNSRFIETISDITAMVVEERFGGACVESDGEDGVRYTEEAQDFFNERYDEIENLINTTLGVYSDNEWEVDINPLDLEEGEYITEDGHRKKNCPICEGATHVAELDSVGCCDLCVQEGRNK